jgi:hypothetical protein
MKNLIRLLFLFCIGVSLSFGQGVRKDDIASSNISNYMVVAPFASIRVCQNGAVGLPCNPLASIYSNSALTNVLSNPLAADASGNYYFYALPGTYLIQITTASGTGSYPDQTLPNLPSSVTTTFNYISVPFSATPTFSFVPNSMFKMTLTGSVTSSTLTGSPLPGATANFSLCQDSVGGHAFSFPSNFNLPSGFTFVTAVNYCNNLLFTYDGTNWQGIGGGGGGSPVGNSGDLQKNNGGVFGASGINDNGSLVNVKEDTQFGGPNPWYDLRQWGWYTSPTYYRTGTTGTMSASSSTLTLASALDFVNGQGLVVLGAGPTPTISTPTGVTAAAVGATGSTTYYYCVVDEDYQNGRTACSAAGSVANAVATLGIQTYTITAGARASGVVTITAANSIISGSQIEVQNGTTGQPSFEGAFTTTSSSSSNVKFNQIGVPDATGTVTSGNLRVNAMVVLKWNAPTTYTVLKHLIYRCTGASCALPANASNYTLVGVATGQDSYFLDRGYTMTAANIDNGDAPQSAPTTTSNGWLATTITAGGGTTTLTLAASSTNAVSGVAVKHDNAPVIKAACAAIPANTGAPILFAPATPGAGAYNYAPFSSFFSFSYGLTAPITANCPGGTEIDFQSTLWLNAPIQLGHNVTMRGGAGGQISGPSGYFEAPTTVLSGYAYPMVYINGQASTNDFMAQFKVTCNQPYQTCLYEDQAVNGDGPTDFRYDDVYLVNTNGNSNAYVAKGGFGRFWTRGIWQNSATSFASPTAALFTVSCGTGMTQPGWATIGYTNYTSIYGGLLIDGCGVASNGFVHWSFTELLTESGYIPAIRVNNPNYGASFSASNFSYADALGGYSTPAIDLTNGQGSSVTITNPACANGFQPLFETTGNYYPGLQVVGQPCAYLGANNGTVSYINGVYANLSDQLGWNTRLQNTAHVAYQMALPAAPASVTLVSGTSALTLGTHVYQLTAVDVDGNETLVGPSVSVTATSGMQNATITAPSSFPLGAVGVNVYRDGWHIDPNDAGCSGPTITTPSGTVTDNYYYPCAANTPYLNQAGASLLSPGGLTSFDFRLPAVPASSITGTAGLTNLYMDNVANWPAFKPNGNTGYIIPGFLSSTVWAAGQCATLSGTTWALVPAVCGTPAFSGLTTGVNNSGQTLTVGSTSTLTYSGTGIVNARQIIGIDFSAASGCGSTTYLRGDGTCNTPTGSGNVSTSTGAQYGIPTWLNSTTLGNVAPSTSGYPLISQGASSYPVFGQVDLTVGVTNKLPNANLANTATTVNGQTCTLGSTCTVPFQTNANGGNTSQAGVTFINSTVNSVGLTATFSNPGTNQEKVEIAGSSYTGNAATATALAANPTTCSAGQAPLGIVASGNATGCFTPSGVQIQTIESNNSSQILLDFDASSTNSIGITLTPSNPSGGKEKFEATGTVNATGGGTGVSAPTAHYDPEAEGSSAFTFISPGAAGLCKMSNGTSADPSYQTCPGNNFSGGTQYGMAYAAGATTITSNSPPTTKGLWYPVWNLSSDAAAAPTNALTGIVDVGISGSTSTYSVAYSNSLQIVEHDSAATHLVTVTIPTPTTLENTQFGFSYVNHTATYTDVLSPTTWTINGNPTLNVGPLSQCRVSVDPVNSNNWLADCAPSTAFVGVTSIATTSPISGGTITSTGTISCPTCAIGPGASVTSGDVTSFNGTGGLIIQDSGTAAANLVTAASNYSGNLVTGTNGAKTTSDSGIAPATVMTCASAGTSGDVVQFAGANRTCSDAGFLASNVPQINIANTFAAHQSFSAILSDSANAGSSSPSILFTGTTFSGTGTTSTPLFSIGSGGAASSWSTAGTYQGFNAASGFTGNFLDFHVNGGASVASLNYQGNLAVAAVNDSGLTVSLPVCTDGSKNLTSTCTGLVTGAMMANNTVTATQLGAQYPKLRCETGLGDGLNAITAGTYVQAMCYNDSGVTWTVTAVKCYVDNASGTSSKLTVAGATLGSVVAQFTCGNNSFGASGSLVNTALTSGDYLNFTFVADGTSKQTTWVVSFTQ